MKEVASKVFHIFFRPLQRKGVGVERMLEGTTVSLETLRDKRGRVEWSELCAIHKNLRQWFTNEDLLELGRSMFRPLGLRFMFVIGRALLTPIGFYRWLNTPRKGGGNQLFQCVQPTFREVSDHECEIDLLLPDGYEVCWDFFQLTAGSFEEMPRLLGYNVATVSLKPIPNGGRFKVTIPHRTRFLTRLRRALMWPFTLRAAARELQEANETLVDRNDELEKARTALERQGVVLDIAYRVGQRIWNQRDPAAAAKAVAEALVEIGGFRGASVDVAAAEAPDKRVQATAGEPGDGRRVDLSGRGQLVGEIRIVDGDGDATAAERLIELLAPTVALSLDNAFAYTRLSAYQTGLETLVDERTRELREAQSARERFFGNVSHEIRTPLSLIMLAAADIQTRAGGALDGRATQSLTTVTDGARKLLRLVDELLLLAAGLEGKLTIHREPTDVAALIANLAAAWRPAAEAAGLELSATAPEALVVRVDPVAFERIASNLVSNAVKYTPRGGRVEIVLAAGGGELSLSVLDTGPGIPLELAARLFERFERGARDVRTQGTGIGLSIVKQLALAHGGTVTVLPLEPHGTRMRVGIPLAPLVDDETGPIGPIAEIPAWAREHAVGREPARALQLPVAVPNTLIASGSRFDPVEPAKGTIVIAEDDPSLAEAIARLLAEKYTAIIALDGEAALEQVKRHQPQLLVTDIDMPGIDGIELSRRFRETTGDKLAPIIILSAVIDLHTRVAGLEAGATDYVTKPFDPRELRARVDAQFRMRDLALRVRQAEQLSTLGILTSGLAHELRNPANAIVNAIAPLTELLPGELIGPDTGPGQLIEVISDCAEQIGFLSRQLLGFRGEAQLELSTAKLSDIIERAMSLATPSAKDVELRTALGADREIRCSPPLMIQALTNLIENGAHAAGPKGWVEVTTWTEGERIAVEVADSGPGVPIGLRDRIFEPFFTTKPPGSGTGLGLPFARAIMQRHGGTLQVRERHGRSGFVLELPAETMADFQRTRYAASRTLRS